MRGVTNNDGAPDSQIEIMRAFLADGFSLGNDNTNTSGEAQIAWCWKAGGAPSGSALSLVGGVGAGTIANDATGVSNVI